MPGEQLSSSAPSPARWAAAGALGGASVVGMLWALLGRAPLPLQPVAVPPTAAIETTPVLESTPSLPVAAPDASAPTVTNGPPPSVPDRASPGPAPVAARSPEPDRAHESPETTGRTASPGSTPRVDPAPRPEPAPASLAPDPDAAASRLDINTASKAELELLPRIGPTLAQRIIEFREAEGRIRSLTHLTDVKGIGVRTAEILEPYIRFD